MNRDIAGNANVDAYHPGGTIPSENQTADKTAQGISVIPPEQVSPFLALPNELLVKLADYLSIVDLRSLDLTSRRLNTLFNTEERLKKLSVRYYGSACDAYRKIIENMDIPAVPGNEIDDTLLRITYLRCLSNEFLASCSDDRTIKVWDLSKPDGQQCVLTLSGHTDRVFSVTALPNGWLASGSEDMTIKVWDLNKPDGK